MPHPKVDNETPIVVEPLMLLDEDGRPALTIVAKLSFEIGGGGVLRPLATQPPVSMGGEAYFPESEISSYRLEPEFAPIKLATDVAVIADAHALGRPAPVVDVGVSVGPLVKAARVFGDRRWLPHGLRELRLSPPRPFSVMPLCYERAFGGTSSQPDGTMVQEPRNPVGRGLAGSLAQLAETLAPNIEDPAQPISSVWDRPAPVGFGFVSPDWQPRAGLAGTYGAQWASTRKPLVPADFRLEFYNAASAGLVAPGYLRGDERVAALNLSPEGRLGFALPGVPPPRVRVSVKGEQDAAPVLAFDTLILDFSARRLSLMWRGRLPLRRGFHHFIGLELKCDYPFDTEYAA
jgi:hypothetical protein